MRLLRVLIPAFVASTLVLLLNRRRVAELLTSFSREEREEEEIDDDRTAEEEKEEEEEEECEISDELSCNKIHFLFVEWKNLRPFEQLLERWRPADRSKRWYKLLMEASRQLRAERNLERARDLISEAEEACKLIASSSRRKHAMVFVQQAIGWLHVCVDLLDVAEHNFYLSVQGWAELKSNHHPMMRDLLLNLSRTCRENGKLSSSIQLAWRAFELGRMLGMEVKDKCEALLCLSNGLRSDGRLVEALMVLNFALEVVTGEENLEQEEGGLEATLMFELEVHGDGRRELKSVALDEMTDVECVILFEMANVCWTLEMSQYAINYDDLWMDYLQVKTSPSKFVQVMSRLAEEREDGEQDLHAAKILEETVHRLCHERIDPEDLARILLRLGEVYRRLGELNKALKTFRQGFKLIQPSPASFTFSRSSAPFLSPSNSVLRACFAASMGGLMLEMSTFDMQEVEDTLMDGRDALKSPCLNTRMANFPDMLGTDPFTRLWTPTRERSGTQRWQKVELQLSDVYHRTLIRIGKYKEAESIKRRMEEIQETYCLQLTR
ncbi:hypothetical protein GUITHDRAFT_103451 [Guillardia theta CCMP2712]|uniref:Uncharacterized protein n=1 Tax=Guillardia theta (strain CCMP2712) TaxID=905079 RepID=L1JQM8_GUITC|nr:hypothetical protein GUITHDRAFT_103451 [Guillardia theta CCMP2712]EKX50861.1 hypothetical protein GUITHDRAFT_103451 [Guillardia theta CCMP2712]|eukprot:XP_005837841.1 hypothetical protein GUITHDRAFT_103451 [Guillardia theta CCMP2712]